MKPLVLQCVSNCRPPIKEEVEELKKKNLCLKELDWLKIKDQVSLYCRGGAYIQHSGIVSRDLYRATPAVRGPRCFWPHHLISFYGTKGVLRTHSNLNHQASPISHILRHLMGYREHIVTLILNMSIYFTSGAVLRMRPEKPRSRVTAGVAR
jgi:hypothetical protein